MKSKNVWAALSRNWYIEQMQYSCCPAPNPSFRRFKAIWFCSMFYYGYRESGALSIGWHVLGLAYRLRSDWRRMCRLLVSPSTGWAIAFSSCRCWHRLLVSVSRSKSGMKWKGMVNFLFGIFWRSHIYIIQYEYYIYYEEVFLNGNIRAHSTSWVHIKWLIGILKAQVAFHTQKSQHHQPRFWCYLGGRACSNNGTRQTRQE